MNKKLTLSVLIALFLTACGSSNSIPNLKKPLEYGNAVLKRNQFELAESHWADVARIRAEAQRLGMQIQNGEITRVQAAQALNQYRLRVAGANPVDDSVYDVYLRAAVDSQRKVITPQQSRAYVENALKGWVQRWPHMDKKPNNPAFTNFLLEHFGMETLK